MFNKMKMKMKMKRKMKMKISMGMIIFFIIGISLASAIGISSDYYSGNPLIMHPGETRNIVFGELQNNVGNTDLVLRANLIDGREIAKLTDSNLEYSVPANTEGQRVNMKVSIPRRNFKGQYEISVEFNNLASSGAGTVPLTLTTEKTIKVIVETGDSSSINPEKPAFNLGWLLLIIFVIILTAYFAIQNKKLHKVR